MNTRGAREALGWIQQLLVIVRWHRRGAMGAHSHKLLPLRLVLVLAVDSGQSHRVTASNQVVPGGTRVWHFF